MKTATFLAYLAAFGTSSVLAAPVNGEFEVDYIPNVEKRANLPGLTATQSSHARAIIAENKKMNNGKQGCLAGIATAITESSIYVYANNAVPKSLNYAHDKIGSDHDSIGIFQQRASIYTNIAKDMDPAGSAEQFFDKMRKVSGWQTMDVGKLCQKVQVSAYPDRYDDNLPLAKKICAADGF